MRTDRIGTPSGLSGRISADPGEVLRQEILDPQFAFEVTHLLPHYVAIERVLVSEYFRMDILDRAAAEELDRILLAVTADDLTARRPDNMSDPAFALERQVEAELSQPVPGWHVDRSRNDLQACAQLMYGREQLIRLAEALLGLDAAVRKAAADQTRTPMPGYTHHQAAQVISPGFYLHSLAEHVQHTLRRLSGTYHEIDACPLGAGAMAGQELPWDRDRMARLLGFRRVRPDGLSAVASRAWALEITAELSIFGTGLSRFATDLLAWGSSEYGFIDLPDHLSGISSAMPQKKNFPVLERIRGRSAHLSAIHVDVLLAQRNTPYSNTVEASKEALADFWRALDTACGTLRLLAEVLRHLRFRKDRMRAACEAEFLGGLTLANRLCLRESVPWRRAQTIAGRYVVAAQRTGSAPARILPEVLRSEAAAAGHQLRDPAADLRGAFDVDDALRRWSSAGSAHPDAVAAALGEQAEEHERLADQWRIRLHATHSTGR
jgi:argininosuccinate lyase